MPERTKHRNRLMLILAVAVATVMAFCSVSYGSTSSDGYILPGDDDAWEISNALNTKGYAKLKPGETYYINSAIRIQRNNVKLVATGATLKGKGQMLNYVGGITNETMKKSGGMKGLTIQGGKWRHNKKASQFNGSVFSIPFVKDIKLIGLDMTSCATNRGHAIELIACKNVTIKNCKVIGYGKYSKNEKNEQIQLDLATYQTAPKLKSNYELSKKWYESGQTCSNITIVGCSVKGCRGICANKADNKHKKNFKYFHNNITVKKCKIVGLSAEALALFNTPKATVTNNTIVSKKSSKTVAESIGCHIAFFGKLPKSMNSSKTNGVVFTGNKCYGGRNAVQVLSHTNSKYLKATFKSNKLYCRAGKSKALNSNRRYVNNLVIKSNTCSGWNGKSPSSIQKL